MSRTSNLYGLLPNGRPFGPPPGGVGTHAEQIAKATTPRPKPTAEQLLIDNLARRVAVLERFILGPGDGR
ncbi:hypothetical protein [Limnoglobus roseus]|uniref:Uncharacterized protein n=1 Tax=Limnoglobus roseus TaxID=2598579 RepID=A0A5C1AM79_9BACT|nr:hypothetical protein [Limnoglobus roseus]QEL19273.1 hypothetical protein PX52LOC_06335 [Limnoglobus roseus]